MFYRAVDKVHKSAFNLSECVFHLVLQWPLSESDDIQLRLMTFSRVGIVKEMKEKGPNFN